MSATSSWARANRVSARANGILTFTDCQYKEAGNRFEGTNLASPVNPQGLLCYEGDVDMITTDFTGTVAVDKINVKTVKVGAHYTDFTWTDDLGEVHTGTLVIETRTKKGMKQGLFPFDFTGFFTGLVTGQ